jgi:hypothetical protein
MNDKILNLIIIILSSIVVGMIIGLIIKEKDHYHGPNAKKQCNKIYYNKKTGKCIKFHIRPIKCPVNKSKFKKLFDAFFIS